MAPAPAEHEGRPVQAGMTQPATESMKQEQDSAVPRALINELGKPAFGIYYHPFERVNLEDFDYRKVAPFPLSLLAKTSSAAIKRGLALIRRAVWIFLPIPSYVRNSGRDVPVSTSRAVGLRYFWRRVLARY